MNSELSEDMGNSFEAINYGIRPNKAVERRLIFETLSKIGTEIDFTQYRYLGLGALLFIDFVHAHLQLGINDLISIEYEENAARAKNNRPFGCIAVVPGDASDVLSSGQIDVTEKPMIVWLDYDGPADNSTLNDIQYICANVPEGSVFLITVNAVRGSYLVKENDDTQAKLPLLESLKTRFGDFFPTSPPPAFDSMNGFPKALAGMLFGHCDHVISRSRIPGTEFTALFNFVYKDGNSPMITIGGMIGAENHRSILSRRLDADDFPPSLPHQSAIELPVLTPRERLALDQLLPALATLDSKAVSKVLGFELSPRLTESYRKLYRHYPTYSQIQATS